MQLISRSEPLCSLPPAYLSRFVSLLRVVQVRSGGSRFTTKFHASSGHHDTRINFCHPQSADNYFRPFEFSRTVQTFKYTIVARYFCRRAKEKTNILFFPFFSIDPPWSSQKHMLAIRLCYEAVARLYPRPTATRAARIALSALRGICQKKVK